jgi:hypothetical protein
MDRKAVAIGILRAYRKVNLIAIPQMMDRLLHDVPVRPGRRVWQKGMQ